MRLIMLGGLRLDGEAYRRVKPMLLLAYLSIEGPCGRRFLAELFWPHASDRQNSLSVALTRLRKAAPGVVEADELRAWTHAESDVREVRAALKANDALAAQTLYTGPFLEGISLSDWGEELEEWVYACREHLAVALRRGLLKRAEGLAARGHFAEAADQAERAHALAGAPAYETEDLARVHALLLAGSSSLLPEIRREAAECGLPLPNTQAEVRAQLQSLLLGRGSESARLLSLGLGEWAWVHSGAGLGKTALLKSLAGSVQVGQPQPGPTLKGAHSAVYLPGRDGLPYATLEPLLGQEVHEGEANVLKRLQQLARQQDSEDFWLFDNWERMDLDTRRVLTLLQEMRPDVRVVISSRQPPPFATDMRLELMPLSLEALAAYPQAWEQTGGLPALVEAFLRGEPLHSVLEARLGNLSAEACEVYLCLALLDAPDLPLVRRALDLAADAMARAAEDLLSAGLILPGGQAEARQIALDHLEAHPTLRARLSLCLAQRLSQGMGDQTLGVMGTGDLAAFPLYEYSRLIWTAADEAGALEAYLSWGRELLRRGFPARAAEVLVAAPPSPATRMLRGRALERAGHFQEALEAVAGLAETPELLALLSTLHWRLGHAELARCTALRALESEQLDMRAEALNTQGNLAYDAGEVEQAKKYFSRAATLWQAVGDRTRWADALNNMAVAEGHSGSPAKTAIESAVNPVLDAAGDQPTLKVTVLLNLGHVYQERGELEHAQNVFQRSIDIADASGMLAKAALAWHDLGAIFHLQSRCGEAERAYREGIDRAQRAGDRRILAMSLANLAELNEDQDAWTEALALLTTSGHAALARSFHDNLDNNHPFRQQLEFSTGQLLFKPLQVKERG